VAIEKLVEKFLFEPETVDIDDIRRLLEAFNYKEKRKPGSECVFHRKGSYPINVPTVKGRHVKSPYVKRITEILNLEEWYEANSEK
jgi:hypothetical protein